MSFHINITASSVAAAKGRLHDAYAPAAVKALIEAALDGMPKPSRLPAGGAQQAAAGNIASLSEKPSEKRVAIEQGGEPRSPILIGILVEAYGHIDVEGGTSEMHKFLVKPIYE